MAFKSTEAIGRQVVDKEGTPVGECHEVWLTSNWNASDIQVEFEKAYAKKIGLSVPFMGYLIVRIEPKYIEVGEQKLQLTFNPAELRDYINQQTDADGKNKKSA